MMPTEYIQSHVLSNKLLTDNLTCQAVVSEVIEYKDIFLGRPHLPSAVLLAIGG